MFYFIIYFCKIKACILNRLHFILKAKTQYNIQSPFLFELYSEVLNARLDRGLRASLGNAVRDRYGEVLYMLGDHYAARPVETHGWDVDDLLESPEVGLIGLVRRPHRDSGNEERWERVVKSDEVTLSIDLFDMGIIFTCNKLSRQHFLLHCQ